MDNTLAINPVSGNGEDIYTNVNPHWTPPWGRGIFGGGTIAQSLCAAQRTVPLAFCAHSMHCYFVRPGTSSDPVFYHVERIRDGNQFAYRMIRAMQLGRCIFTAAVSFAQERPPHQIHTLKHAAPMPIDLKPPPSVVDSASLTKTAPAGENSSFECVRHPVESSGPEVPPEQRKVRQWIRAKGLFGNNYIQNPSAEHQSHMAALAYMTDCYFIGTTARVHGATRFADKEYIDRMVESLGGSLEEKVWRRGYFEDLASEEFRQNASSSWNSDGQARVRVGMMVSLDHTIFFHQPRSIVSDQWMLAEMDSPWIGNERGLVMQRIWSQTGELIATCVQEGILRLARTGLQDAKL
jgi:acyl-CoA thioesterase 8